MSLGCIQNLRQHSLKLRFVDALEEGGKYKKNKKIVWITKEKRPDRAEGLTFQCQKERTRLLWIELGQRKEEKEEKKEGGEKILGIFVAINAPYWQP